MNCQGHATATLKMAFMSSVVMFVGGCERKTNEAIRIGELNSYTGPLAGFTEPYKQGWQLAIEEVNTSGGVRGGRKIEAVSRDDGGQPSSAVTVARELVTREKVVVLMGTYLSNVGLAVSNYAQQAKIPFLAAEPLSDAMTGERKNEFTYRLRPNTTMQATMLAEEAAKLPAKRWATVAPNYEYGQSAVAAFKRELTKRRPDVLWIGEQWPPLFKIDGAAVVQALAKTKPDAIFNVTFSSDLAQFVREGDRRGLFTHTAVVSLLSGEPEYLNPLGADAPRGWIVTGYPVLEITDSVHAAFVQAYQKRWNAPPGIGALVGYIAARSMAAALDRAKSLTSEDIAHAFSELRVSTPVGQIVYRASDHQATLGTFVGKTDLRNGRGVMIDWHYADGALFLPPEGKSARH